MDSKKWLNDIREVKKYNDEIISLRNGLWQVKNKGNFLLKYSPYFYDSHLDLIKAISLKVLSEIHPMFDLKSEDRFATAIYGKVHKYSIELRKGISETLAFLGVYGTDLENCTLGKPEMTATLVVRELFNDSDWKLWASLNDLLPILAEAAPSEFLSSVENALKQQPCPFDELFKQEGTDINYLTGLYWALEVLAWSEEYLSRTILVLAELATHDRGGNWGNRPDNSITTILLPWFPQTTASIEKRIAALKGVQRNYRDVAWKILIRLMPNRQQTSTGTYKPAFRKFISEDWNSKVTHSEYTEQIKAYAEMAIDMAKGNIEYVSELVNNLDNIPQPSLNVFIEYLSSDEIKRISEEKRRVIWESLNLFISKHRQFSDAKWALPKETVDLLEKVAKEISPQKPELIYRQLFSGRDLDLMNKNEDWQTQLKKINDMRVEAIENIYESNENKVEALILFANSVGNPSQVGSTFALFSNEENEAFLLPSFLSSKEQNKKQFINGYIWTRYNKFGKKWLENFQIEKWTLEERYNLLLCLPFENEIWEKVDEYLGVNAEEYWKRVNKNPFPTQSNLLIAIKNLLKYNRPKLALKCIEAQKYKTKEFYKDLAIESLNKILTSDESFESIDTYDIIDIIKILQNDSDISEEVLFNIEWMYLPLLNGINDAEPKILEKYLSQKPEFFIEVIQLLYRSKKEEKTEKQADEQTEKLASNAWKLLHEWKRPPGMLDDGSFSSEAFKNWANEVRLKTSESGHLEVALNHLGSVLFYTPPDLKSLWINLSVAEYLDEKENDTVRRGFVSAIFNSRGVYTVDPSGEQEREIARIWKAKADELENEGFVRFATALKELANSYEREAERVIRDFGNQQEDEDDY